MTARRAGRGWLILAAYVVVHNVRAAARGDEMLSHAVDRYLVEHRVLTYGVIGTVALHLANLMPSRYDWLGGLMGWIARKIGPLH